MKERNIISIVRNLLNETYQTLQETQLRKDLRADVDKTVSKLSLVNLSEEPFPYKVREKDAIQRHMDADERLSKIDLKIRYYDIMLKFLEEVIKCISNRTFQIKNALEWHKFTAGYN